MYWLLTGKTVGGDLAGMCEIKQMLKICGLKGQLICQNNSKCCLIRLEKRRKGQL